jgi:multidrug efflux pump subunit AcrB
MNFLGSALKNRQVIYLLTSIVVLLGLHALLEMPRREDPQITIRTGLVIAGYPGATAEQVEAQVRRRRTRRRVRES